MHGSGAIASLLFSGLLAATSVVSAAPIPLGPANPLRVDVAVPLGLSLANEPISIEFEFSGFDSGESFSAVVFKDVGGILIPPRLLYQNIGGIFVPFSDSNFFNSINGPAQTAELFVLDIASAASGFTIAMWMNVGSADLEGFTATATSFTTGEPIELIDSLANGSAVPEPSTFLLIALGLLVASWRPMLSGSRVLRR